VNLYYFVYLRDSEVFRFLGYYAAKGGFKLTFRDYLSVASLEVQAVEEEELDP
jgi:hypothetical protein